MAGFDGSLEQKGFYRQFIDTEKGGYLLKKENGHPIKKTNSCEIIGIISKSGIRLID